jgi:hypothetical protein
MMFGHYKTLRLTDLPALVNCRYREVGQDNWAATFTDMHAVDGTLTLQVPAGKCMEFEFRCASHEWEKVIVDATTKTKAIDLRKIGIAHAITEGQP